MSTIENNSANNSTVNDRNQNYQFILPDDLKYQSSQQSQNEGTFMRQEDVMNMAQANKTQRYNEGNQKKLLMQ